MQQQDPSNQSCPWIRTQEIFNDDRIGEPQRKTNVWRDKRDGGLHIVREKHYQEMGTES